MVESEAKQGEISKEMVRLSELKEQLHNRIGMLFDRLQGLLCKSLPSKNPCNMTPNVVLQSPFAVDLSSISATLETDIEQVNDIIGRLEL